MNFIDKSTNKKYTIQQLDNFLKSIIDKNTDIYIGSDSQESGKYLVVATVIVIHKNNNGAKFLYYREKLDKKIFKSLRQRLLYETQKAIEIAINLSEIAEKCRKFSVHVDINNDKRFKSSKFANEAKSYVTSQGFNCEIKPNAWASSCVADRMTKNISN